jgi:hypothetical protein
MQFMSAFKTISCRMTTFSSMLSFIMLYWVDFLDPSSCKPEEWFGPI